MSVHNASQTTGRIDRWFYHIANVFAVIGGLGLIVLMGITVVSVFWRYALRDPIFGVGDLSSMTLAVVVSAGVAYGAVYGAHITVNIIAAILGRKLTRLTDVVVRGFGGSICAYAAYALAKKGSCGLSCGLTTENLVIPKMPFYFMLSAAMAVVAALTFYHLIVGLQHWAGADPNEEDV
ncbi:TRAP transporter small permease [Celeribacter arenosi]|uniref:TRAP transporter small permease protein n=1 Tax=Celeribacter arenosi TaxID=792649 RepID=A0ABP7JV76_9RHOB